MEPTTKYSERFATVRNGKIVATTIATPHHELKPNQFEITEEEYYLLKSIHPKNNEDILDVIMLMCLSLDERVNNAKDK